MKVFVSGEQQGVAREGMEVISFRELARALFGVNGQDGWKALDLGGVPPMFTITSNQVSKDKRIKPRNNWLPLVTKGRAYHRSISVQK